MVTSSAKSWRRGWLSRRAGWIATLVMIPAAWTTPSADAGILGFSGDVALIMPPPSVESEQLLPNDMAGSFLFLERERYTLPTAVDVDWDSSIATNGQIEEGTGFFPGTIAAGTAVDSIYFHFDTPLQALGGVVVTVATDSPILGVIVTPSLLDASDTVLGAPGTAYPTGLDFRGTAGQVNEADRILISPNLDLIEIFSQVEVVLDGIRIITAPIPEPASLTLVALGLIGTYLRGSRRMRALSC